MHFQAVASSSIAAVGYDAELATLALRFHTGAEYHYFAVPQRLYRELLAADSIGAHFHAHIRNGGYHFQRVS